MITNNQSECDRGQSTVIGFVLIIGILIVMLSFAVIAEKSVQTENEITHNEQVDRAMINLQSDTQTATASTQQTSIISSEVDYSKGLLYSSIPKKSFNVEKSGSSKTAEISYSDGIGSSQTITEQSDSLRVEKEYSYISNVQYTIEHSLIYRQSNGDVLITRPLLFPNDSAIVIQNQDVTVTDANPTVMNARITATESEQEINPSSDVTYKIETETPRSEVERQIDNSSKSHIKNVERNGDFIVFTLEQQNYSIITQEINIEE